MSIRVVALLSLILLGTPPAAAWGDLGHRVVGELAERQLSRPALAQVRELLADEADPTLAGIASWADAVREMPGYGWTSSLHYVNVRDRHCRFDAARDCRGEACVVGAIRRYARKLGDPAVSRAGRAEALKFLVHFVGDVHQPLHAGRRPDQGGNDFQLSLRRAGDVPEGTNLHAVWDSKMLAAGDEGFERLVARLLAATPADVPTFDPDAPRRWAEASCALTDLDGFYPRRPGRLEPRYFDAMRPLADARLREAGTQLAGTIESALARLRASR